MALRPAGEAESPFECMLAARQKPAGALSRFGSGLADPVVGLGQAAANLAPQEMTSAAGLAEMNAANPAGPQMQPEAFPPDIAQRTNAAVRRARAGYSVNAPMLAKGFAAKSIIKWRPGRLRIGLDTALLRRLATIGCTEREMASVLGISLDTLQRRKADDPAIVQTIEEGRAVARVWLRWRQWECARAGNVTLPIFLGKISWASAIAPNLSMVPAPRYRIFCARPARPAG